MINVEIFHTGSIWDFSCNKNQWILEIIVGCSSLRLYNLGSENTTLTLLLLTLCGSVDGSEILLTHQLRLIVYPIIYYTKFYTFQVVGNGISEPATAPQKRNDWNWTAGDLELRMPILMCGA